jgi:hypothetical protein
MAAEPEVDLLDSLEADILRSKYRCSMCHKRCQVPCTFTGAEFRALAAAVRKGGTPPPIGPSPREWIPPQ